METLWLLVALTYRHTIISTKNSYISFFKKNNFSLSFFVNIFNGSHRFELCICVRISFLFFCVDRKQKFSTLRIFFSSHNYFWLKHLMEKGYLLLDTFITFSFVDFKHFSSINFLSYSINIFFLPSPTTFSP